MPQVVQKKGSGCEGSATFSGGEGSSGRVGGHIDFLGPEPGGTLAMFVVYYCMGRIFAEGARSLHEVNRALESRSFIGKLPPGIPYGTASLSRYGSEAE